MVDLESVYPMFAASEMYPNSVIPRTPVFMTDDLIGVTETGIASYRSHVSITAPAASSSLIAAASRETHQKASGSPLMLRLHESAYTSRPAPLMKKRYITVGGLLI